MKLKMKSQKRCDPDEVSLSKERTPRQSKFIHSKINLPKKKITKLNYIVKDKGQR